MPKELKNSTATLQRMVEKALADQKGRNVEVYLEDIVVKSKDEQSLMEDMEETLNKLKWVNMKIDPNESTYGIKKGRFMGYTITEDGIRPDPAKIQAVYATRGKKRSSNTYLLCQSAVARHGNMIYSDRKTILALIHKARSLRTTFWKHQIKVMTNNPMEEVLKILGTRGRLAKWAAKIRTYNNSYVRTNEAEGRMVNKFLKQKELLPHMLKGQEEQTLRQCNKLQVGLTPMPRAWRFYLSRETALLAGLVASAGKCMKDLHVFIDSKVLVDQVEGSRTPSIEEARKYRKEIIDAMVPFYRFWITYLPKKLNSKAEVLTGLATIKLEVLNQEVLVGIKTRPLVKVRNDGKDGKATSKVPTRKLSYN
ncbi:reverse transcriptase domain-containing protein [Tanacetum coccineum]